MILKSKYYDDDVITNNVTYFEFSCKCASVIYTNVGIYNFYNLPKQWSEMCKVISMSFQM